MEFRLSILIVTARRGNDRVMTRGTFANIRIRNLLVPGTEGGVTRLLPGSEIMPVFDAAERYKATSTPLVILAGEEYGTGSSRDWAAKGTMLLGFEQCWRQALNAFTDRIWWEWESCHWNCQNRGSRWDLQARRRSTSLLMIRSNRGRT